MNAFTYRAEIDGLRALAIISVIIFHLNENWLPGGFIGVDVFFVISGYLIASLAMRAENFKAREFLRKRATRTLPVYFLTLLVVLVAGIALMPPEDLYQLAKKVFSASLQLSNIASLRTDPYFDSDSLQSPTLHTWSLGVEWQFYLLTALLLTVLPNKKRFISAQNVFFLIAVTSFAFSIFVSFHDDPKWSRHAYYNPLSRLWEFYIGIIVANLIFKNCNRFAKAVSYIGTVLLFGSFFLIDADSKFPGLIALLPTIGTGCLIYGTRFPSIIQAVLKLRFIVWIGLISYSLYLWHWPVLAYVRYIWSENDLSWNAIVFCLATTMILSLISYYQVELKRFGSKKKGWSWAKGGLQYTLLTTILFCSAIVSTRGFANLHSDHQDQANHPTCSDYASCGDINADRSLLLFGDSHAGHFATLFDQVAADQNFNLTIEHVPGCSPFESKTSITQSECQRLYSFLRSNTNHFSITAVSARWENYPLSSDDKARLKKVLTQLLERSDKLVVLGQIPSYENMPKTAVFLNRRYGLNLNVTPTPSNRWLSANQQIKEVVDEIPSVEFYDTAEFFCRGPGKASCSPFISGKLAYEDNNHITANGSLAISAFLSERLFQ